MSIDFDVTSGQSGLRHAVGHGPDGVLRQFRTGPYTFETGGHLPEIVIGYETWGELNQDASNAVLLEHALTGDTHVARGDSDTAGWWDGFVGPGKTIDTDRFFVVAPNILGGCYGTTGPSTPDETGRPLGSRFPFTTIRDGVRVEARLADALGIRRWHTVIGGSMGGARALEWAAEYPDRVRNCVVIAACAESTAEQIAFAQIQTQSIRLDPGFRGGDYYGVTGPDGTPAPGPVHGLGIARRLAHITYRSEPEMDVRFGRQAQHTEDPFGSAGYDRGRYQVESYLDHQASKLVGRFDANSYIVLTEALMSHDVGRGRGGAQAALSGLSGVRFFVAAVDSDRLYWPEQSERLARLLPGAETVHYITSPIGHDGFLTDIEQLGESLRAEIFA